jgi:hypothetical protein
MKKIILFMCMGLLLSCSSDDDNSSASIEKLNASWDMIQFLDMNDGIPALGGGTVTWTFNTSQKKLSVVNNGDPAFYLLKTGSYNIKISGNILNIIQPEFNTELKYSFTKKQLILEMVDLPDGPKIKFNKI